MTATSVQAQDPSASRWRRFWAAFAVWAQAMEMSAAEYQDMRLTRLENDMRDLRNELSPKPIPDITVIE